MFGTYDWELSTHALEISTAKAIFGGGGSGGVATQSGLSYAHEDLLDPGTAIEEDWAMLGFFLKLPTDL